MHVAALHSLYSRNAATQEAMNVVRQANAAIVAQMRSQIKQVANEWLPYADYIL